MLTTGIEDNVLMQKYGYLPGMQSSAATGENMFLQILTTQMRNQDPLSPLENGDFVQQMAGLAQVKESATLNSNLNALLAMQEIVAGQNAFTQSAALVGKNIQYLDPKTGDEKSGYVSAVKLESGALLLSIAGQDIPMSSVVGITASGSETPETPETPAPPPASDDSAAQG